MLSLRCGLLRQWRQGGTNDQPAPLPVLCRYSASKKGWWRSPAAILPAGLADASKVKLAAGNIAVALESAVRWEPRQAAMAPQWQPRKSRSDPKEQHTIHSPASEGPDIGALTEVPVVGEDSALVEGEGTLPLDVMGANSSPIVREDEEGLGEEVTIASRQLACVSDPSSQSQPTVDSRQMVNDVFFGGGTRAQGKGMRARAEQMLKVDKYLQMYGPTLFRSAPTHTSPNVTAFVHTSANNSKKVSQSNSSTATTKVRKVSFWQRWNSVSKQSLNFFFGWGQNECAQNCIQCGAHRVCLSLCRKTSLPSSQTKP